MTTRAIAGLSLLAVFATVSAWADDDADIRAMLRQMKAAESETQAKLENYGWNEEVVDEEGGKVKSRETYATIFYKDRVVRRLMEKDGHPLAAGALEKENRRVEKLVTQLERGTAPPLDNRRLRLEDLIAAASFSHVQHEQVQGRDLVTCEFHPRPGIKPANSSERFIQNLDGRLWLDPRAQQLVQAEFVLRRDFKVGGGLLFNMRKGTRYNEDGLLFQNEIWLPKTREFTMAAKAMIGIKLNIRNSVVYSDHHRFNVDATSKH